MHRLYLQLAGYSRSLFDLVAAALFEFALQVVELFLKTDDACLLYTSEAADE